MSPSLVRSVPSPSTQQSLARDPKDDIDTPDSLNIENIPVSRKSNVAHFISGAPELSSHLQVPSSPAEDLVSASNRDIDHEDVKPSIEQDDYFVSSEPGQRLSPYISRLYETYSSQRARTGTKMSTETPNGTPSMSVRELLKQARSSGEQTAREKAEEERQGNSSVTSALTSFDLSSAPAAVAMTPDEPQMPPPTEDEEDSPPEESASPVMSPDCDDVEALQMPDLEPKEHLVPMTLVSHTKGLYMQEIQNKKNEIRDFLRDEPDSAMCASMTTLLDRLADVCNHQDLLEEEESSTHMSDLHVQRWAENVSTKCVFVIDFIQLMRSIDYSVFIVVRPGRMLTILETCFRNSNFDYQRLDQPPSPPNASNLNGVTSNSVKIFLAPSNIDYTTVEVPPLNLVIAFDSSFDREKHIRWLRGDCKDPDKLAHIIHLTVVCSVEHLDLWIPREAPASQRLIALIGCITRLGDKAGYLDKDKESTHFADAAARMVAEFVTDNDENGEWPLSCMPAMEGLEGIVHFDFVDSETYQNSLKLSRSPPPSLESKPTKRSLVSLFGEDVPESRLLTTA